ncbi:MAG: hypothetical protein DSY70_02360 [Desulfobulbus sp.]|nr:MAG: hypothetical protein DSY70_02360 [Desulfobulbus sp.]
MDIQFAEPFWLIAGMITCVLAALFIRANILRRKESLQNFASSKLIDELTRNVSFSRRRIKNILLILAIAFLFVGLARPQYGNRWVEIRRKGIDILIGVDVSKSMLVQDISPNRLERAKLAIKDFVSKLEGDRVGLLPFAGTAFLMCPLTTDYDAFIRSLDAMDINTIPKGGTNIGKAILEAEKTLANEANHKIFVLVTDGEDLSEAALSAARKAKENGMTIYTIGVGTPEGELIPAPGTQAKEFIKNRAGEFVTSRLDEKTLTKIADITGGLYAPLGNMGQGFDAIYQQKLSLVPKEEHAQRKRKVPIEQFPWPLGVAALLLASDFLITGRKNRWSLRLPFIKTAARRKKQMTGTLTILLLAFAWTTSVRASEGEQLFAAGEYAQADTFYRNSLKKSPDDPVLHFNLGDTAYRTGKYEQAIAEFNQALKTKDLTLQAKSYFNRGNAQFFQGKAVQKTDPENTVQLWQQALNSFQAVLQLTPDDTKAAHNLDIVKNKLEKLKKQQKKKEQKQKKNKKNSQQKQGQKKKQNSQKKNKDQNKQNEKNKPGQPENSSDKNPDNTKQQNPAKPAPGRQQQDKTNGGKKPQPGNEKDKRPVDQIKKQEAQRRLQGKMTKQEAKNLLNSLKNEEKELNFLPRDINQDADGAQDW